MAVLLFQASLSFGKLLTCQVPVDAANCVIGWMCFAVAYAWMMVMSFMNSEHAPLVREVDSLHEPALPAGNLVSNHFMEGLPLTPTSQASHTCKTK
jgi:hypothetical protein